MKTVGVRCSKSACRKRYVLPANWKDLEFSPKAHACGCGSTKFVEDEWRKKRGRAERCDCSNYYFPHRKGSQKCIAHPLASWHIARDRYNLQGEQLHDVWLHCVWESEGGQLRDVPF